MKAATAAEKREKKEKKRLLMDIEQTATRKEPK